MVFHHTFICAQKGRCGSIGAMEPEEVRYMSERERRVALLLVGAGIRSATDLWKLVRTQSPELDVDRATVHRYLHSPPRRMDYRVVEALAKALGVGTAEAFAALSDDQATARFLSDAIRGSPDDPLDVASAATG
jgi:hypothetical protein